MSEPKAPLISLSEPLLGDEELEAAQRVIRSGWLTLGPETEAFEREFAAVMGAKHAVALANGTAALHLAYLAAGLGEGDEFLLPALTFAATLNAGLYLKAKPMLVDCASENDLTLSPADIERKITPRTKLIVTMPYGGFCPDMKAILEIARARNIAVAEDACHAPLASLDGRNIGTFGEVSTWSFYGNKNMTTGEGGMALTNSGEIARRIRLLRSHGMTALTWDRQRGHASAYDVVELGYNYRMDELRAAIGRVQLRKLPEANARRARASEALRRALAPCEELGVSIPFAQPRGVSANHLFVILLPAGANREVFRARLREDGVMTSVHYPPLYDFSHARAFFASVSYSPVPADLGLPVFEKVKNRLVTLPLGPTLTEEQIARIADSCKKTLRDMPR